MNTPDMVYVVAASTEQQRKGRMLVIPIDANGFYLSPAHWKLLFNVRVKYKREYLAKIAKDKCFQFLDYTYTLPKAA